MNKRNILFIFTLFLLLISLNFSSGYTYRNSDTWTYTEDHKGKIRGFTLTHSTSDNYDYGCDWYSEYDRSYDAIRCRIHSRYGDYRYEGDSYYSKYNSDRILREAFKTYQQNSMERNRNRHYRYNYYRPYTYRYW